MEHFYLLLIYILLSFIYILDMDIYSFTFYLLLFTFKMYMSDEYSPVRRAERLERNP